MTVLQVRFLGDPVLKTRAEEITEFSSALRTLIGDMQETMHAYGGVGLAANQVGVLERVFVYDCGDGQEGHIINPVWEPVGEETVINPEGCLSIPDVRKDTERFAVVRVRGKNIDGEDIDFEAEGLLARCIQHETDHLDGVLFLSRLSKELRREAMAEIRSAQWFQ